MYDKKVMRKKKKKKKKGVYMVYMDFFCFFLFWRMMAHVELYMNVKMKINILVLNEIILIKC